MLQYTAVAYAVAMQVMAIAYYQASLQLHVLLMPLQVSHYRGLLVRLRIRQTRVAAGDVILTLRAVKVIRH